MDLNDQLRHFFGSEDISTLSPDAVAAGTERMQVAFGLETDGARRFALWTLLHMFGAAPDLDVAFSDPADRDAARNFMDLMDRGDDG